MVRSAVYSFADDSHFEHVVPAGDLRTFPTARGDFRAELIRIDLDKLWLQSAIESLPRTAHFAIHPGRAPIFFLAGAGDAAIQQSGTDFRPESILFFGRDSSHYQRAPANSRWASISLTPDELASAGSALAGRALARSDLNTIVKPSAAALACLRDLHGEARRLARQSPETLARPEVARALEAALVRTMVSCLGEGKVEALDAGARLRLRIMARLEELLAANPARPLYLIDICRSTGASERTLRRCCHEQLGMGPNRFLLLRRLHLAHRELLRGDCRAKTVTEVATGPGFWELGRFAAAYRAQFGETPVATLRRPPDEPKARQGASFFSLTESA